MKRLFNKVIAGLLLMSAVFGACTKNELSEEAGFMLFYPDVTDIGLSYNMNVKPTYRGQTPSDFKVYDVTLDGSKCETDAFFVEENTGVLQIRSNASMQVGLYAISISCVSGGKVYEFPDVVKVNLMRPAPAGITMDPAELELFVTQVNDVNSTDELPSSRVVTEGEHITIKSYHIANVRRDGQALEEWDKFFAIDNAAGVVSVIRNPAFVPGDYVLDLKLLTTAVTMESEEGFFAEALKVAVVSPPVELAYEPAVKRVEEGTGFISQPPYYVASAKGLKFALKAVYPESTPVTVEESTGVITLSEDNSLVAGDQVLVSVTVSNAYGSKDFDQIMKIDIVEYIEPISRFSYEDVTMWYNTECRFKPVEVDGDDVRFAFVDLPESLSALTIDELTGEISIAKGNKVPVGEYVMTVKVSNDKGFMTDDIALKVIENPYFFTKVTWGNNLGLTPVLDYASQHRIRGSEEVVVVSVDKENSDIKDWDNVRFELVDGSKVKTSDTKIKYASIDEATGDITLDPSVLTSIDNKRAHVIVIDVIAGEGTVGETVCRVPVFFDFNAPRAKAGVPEYTVEYTPFVIQCNPKAGGTFPAPSIKDADGVELADKSHIRMTYRRSANYWNIGGPQTHVNGDPNTAGTFLNLLWNSYYGTSGSLYNNVIPVYSYNKSLDKNIAYIKDDLTLYVAPEKWRLEDGYADGVFVAEVILGYEGKDPGSGVSPYKMYPFFIWFDTEF